MKRLFFIFLLLCSLLGFSQELECCKTVKNVKEMLKGDWKVKGDDSKTFYYFWFDGDSGGMNQRVMTDQEGEYDDVTCQPFVNILEVNKMFKIEFIELVSSSIQNIYVLNHDSLIFGDNEVKVEYERVKD